MAYEKEVNRAVAMMCEEMTADPGPVRPRLMAFPPAWAEIDKPFSYPLPGRLMEHWQSKNVIGGMIVTILFQAKARVVVFFTDALFGAPPKGRTLYDMPVNLSAWPRSLVHEALLCNVNAIGMRGYALSYAYTRDGKNRRVFENTQLPEKLDTGRFCFDLTDATEESATLDALNRNRMGKLEAGA